MTGVVVGIARPNKAVIGHLVSFFARDFAGFATDAHRRIGEEPNLDMIADERVSALVRAFCAFADHVKSRIRKAGKQENRAEECRLIRAQ